MSTPSRGAVLSGAAATAAGAAVSTVASTVASTATATAGPGASAAPRTDPDVVALEQRYGATVGLVARNLRTGAVLRHRPDVRFPMCSTFKTVAAAAVLDRGVDLDRVVRYTEADLVDGAPVTGQRRAMTYGELCDAAIRFSDNTAGNLLLRRLGGPQGLTRFFRRVGDDVSRLDRTEPDLNAAVPGDVRDTTTPRAIADTYRRLLTGDVLRPRCRWVLTGWLQSNTTSVATTRTALPEGWWLADKTGAGSYGVVNDVGLATAPDGTQVLVAALTRGSDTDAGATGDRALLVDLFRLSFARLT